MPPERSTVMGVHQVTKSDLCQVLLCTPGAVLLTFLWPSACLQSVLSWTRNEWQIGNRDLSNDSSDLWQWSSEPCKVFWVESALQEQQKLSRRQKETSRWPSTITNQKNMNESRRCFVRIVREQCRTLLTTTVCLTKQCRQSSCLLWTLDQ